MKNISLFLLLFTSVVYGQFSVNVKMNKSLGNTLILSKLDGSKYIILDSKQSKINNIINVPENYKGMLKIFWPETNQTVQFISENKDVNIALDIEGNKIKDVHFLDDSNALMKSELDKQQKNEFIFPALIQIQPYYSKDTEFYKAIEAEIYRLSIVAQISSSKNPFVDFYFSNYKKYIQTSSTDKPVSKEQIRKFISSSNEMLESSSLLKPLLINYLNESKDDIEKYVDLLLDEVQVDTPRGQTVLSELIDLFSGYGMTKYEDMYLDKAKGLKCTINERLNSTLDIHKNTQIGAVFTNYTFSKNVSNTKVKSIHDVKANKKIIIFWSSECAHCKKDLPELLHSYNKLKSKNIEIIGLSVDSDKFSYEKEIMPFKWVNDTELRGWESSFADTYNINGTPTYFILDKDNKIIAKPSRVSDVLNFLEIK